MTARLLVLPLLLAVASAACSQTVDPDGLPSIEGYQSWTQLPPLTNPIAGHGASYRVIYLNDVARTFAHTGRYAVGTVVVKEIHEITDTGGQGALRYVAVMRKIGEEPYATPPAGVPNDGGWVFTQIKGGGPEEYFDLCWNTCHRQAPFDGAWLDYGD